MQHFYGINDNELLNLSTKRFWGKFKNMSILKLRTKIDMIHTINVSQSKDVGNEIYKLNWQIEQLTETEKVDVDGLIDIKKRMKKLRKKNKKRKRQVKND